MKSTDKKYKECMHTHTCTYIHMSGRIMPVLAITTQMRERGRQTERNRTLPLFLV
jgi:hypothetical protein